MRIGMMADVYKPHISGVTNYISLNKAVLERLGHEVYVFTFGSPDAVDDEINVVSTPGVPLVDSGFYFGLRHSREVKCLIQTMDLVHVHHPFLSGQLALRYCRPLNIPIVFTNHTRYDLYFQTYLPPIAESLGTTFLEGYLPSFCRSVDLVVAPSPGLEKVLRKIGVDAQMEVIPNGVDLRRFQVELPPVDRKDFDFHPEDVVLIYVGRLAPEKNLPFLLRCFTGVVQAVPNARLLLVGAGPDLDPLKMMACGLGIQDCVRFTGSLPYTEIPRYLDMADAFITASVTEVHPLSVIEAMAAGLPVLGIDSPGVGDTVENDVTGYLTSEDIASYTAKMVRMVSEKPLRERMSAAARQAAKKYSIERTAPMVLDVYQRLADQARNRRQSLRMRMRSITERWRN